MKVLSEKPVASIHECVNCHCILAYNISDIYEGHFIYCPVCKYKQRVNLELAYDGVVKDGKVKN